ncbi:MAG: amidophosphoribosyltransferase [Ruminococcaceae bacterium]|nr:amidophosphoribosyltransferase [Oscillospiraceae bacterium]
MNKQESVMISDKLKEECGVFGFYDNDGFDVARLTYYGLYGLQHRGQQSAGIAVNDDNVFRCHKDLGLVPDIFNDRILSNLNGTISVGHVRYSTKGGNKRENAQPLVYQYVKGTLALAYNGNLINAGELREEFQKNGAIFHTTIDPEVMMYKIAQERIKTHAIERAVLNMMDYVHGAYSLVLMSPRKLIGARDPYGLHPLSIGKLENSYVLSSETCVFDNIGAEFIRDVEPGEVVWIDKDGLHSIKHEKALQRARICVFEYVYNARPDSVIQGASVYEVRKAMGHQLAKEHPVDADLVFGVPDSGLCAAIGYAEESGLPYGKGFIKNKYVGRTFILPTQAQREAAVNIKLNVLRSSVEGKRVVMIDDSIVRGTTCANIIRALKDAGAKEVHMRVSSPPFLWPCYFGTDIPSRDCLMAVKYSIEEIRQKIGADSLGYLSIDGLKEATKSLNCDYCQACFTGKYPMDVPLNVDKSNYEHTKEGKK